MELFRSSRRRFILSDPGLRKYVESHATYVPPGKYRLPRANNTSYDLTVFPNGTGELRSLPRRGRAIVQQLPGDIKEAYIGGRTPSNQTPVFKAGAFYTGIDLKKHT